MSLCHDTNVKEAIVNERSYLKSLAAKDASLLFPPPSYDAHARQILLQRAFAQQALRQETARVLLLEGIHERAVELLTHAGYTRLSQMRQALDEGGLREKLSDVAVVGVRSRTQIRAQSLVHAKQLLAIGCFSVGTNQVDLDAARNLGIPVFNAPFANTRSVAELVIGEIVMLVRQIFPRSAAAHNGEWRKGAAGSREIRGKTLGIVGYGSIGAQLSQLAEAMGMHAIYFDIVEKLSYGNAAAAGSLSELLERSDIVSLHVPETSQTHCMIGRAELAMMREGSYLINNSRGTVVDVEALAESLRNGHLAGAAIDVFPVEPSSNSDAFLSPLRGLDNVILTPHIGGSTEEAQERIGEEVAKKLINFIRCGSTVGAVNFPQLQVPDCRSSTRIIYVNCGNRLASRSVHDVLARHTVDVDSQHFGRDGEVEYIVTDVSKSAAKSGAILEEMRAIEGTVKVRLAFCP